MFLTDNGRKYSASIRPKAASESFALPVDRTWRSHSNLSGRVGNAGDLLFESAVVLASAGSGGLLFGFWHLGSMVGAEGTTTLDLCRPISGSGRLAYVHPSFA